VSEDQDVGSRYSTAQKGEIAMLRVLQRAVERGWLATRPTRDYRYDLVLDDGERVYRVQVKYAARAPSAAREQFRWTSPRAARAIARTSSTKLMPCLCTSHPQTWSSG